MSNLRFDQNYTPINTSPLFSPCNRCPSTLSLFCLIQFSLLPSPPTSPPTFYSRATRLKMSAPSDTWATKSTSLNWVWYCSCFQFSVLFNRIHAFLVYIFVFSLHIFLFTPFFCLFLLIRILFFYQTIAYSILPLFFPLFRTAFTYSFLRVRNKIETRRRVQLPRPNKTQQYKIWGFHSGTCLGPGLDTVQPHWWVSISLHI